MQTRPVFRRSSNRVIGGVCAGISEYLGWDPRSTRILYALFLVVSVFVPAIVVYMVLWTMMPGPEKPRRPG
ncbi:MAG: PspC domain-containing protein [Gammaproteobacteria bacterium]|nr:PspC domain-containing protein [Gammaproteobacteria bacterium]